jgi:hypothetical protein
MILTLLLVQHVAGHVDVDGMDTSVAPADDFLAFTNGACSPNGPSAMSYGTPSIARASSTTPTARRIIGGPRGAWRNGEGRRDHEARLEGSIVAVPLLDGTFSL